MKVVRSVDCECIECGEGCSLLNHIKLKGVYLEPGIQCYYCLSVGGGII